MTKEENYVVRKPTKREGGWVVVIASGASPLADIIETVPAGNSYHAAFQTYRNIKKDVGAWL